MATFKVDETAARGFLCRCPDCGHDDGTLFVRLHDANEVVCEGCERTFTPEEVAEVAARLERELKHWKQLAQWLSLAPILED